MATSPLPPHQRPGRTPVGLPPTGRLSYTEREETADLIRLLLSDCLESPHFTVEDQTLARRALDAIRDGRETPHSNLACHLLGY